MFIWPCIVLKPFSIKPTHVLSSKFYFGNAALHVSGSFPAHHQELSTVQLALAHLMQVWRTLACRIRVELILQTSGRQTCIKCANADCKVDNSWWRAGKLPEICRVALPKLKFGTQCIFWFYWKGQQIVIWTGPNVRASNPELRAHIGPEASTKYFSVGYYYKGIWFWLSSFVRSYYVKKKVLLNSLMLLHGSSYLFMRTILNILIRCLSFGRFIYRLIITICTMLFAYGIY